MKANIYRREIGVELTELPGPRFEQKRVLMVTLRHTSICIFTLLFSSRLELRKSFRTSRHLWYAA